MLNPYVLDLTLLGQIKKNQTDIAHSLTFATSWSCTTETYVWPTGAKFVGTYQNNQKHGGLLSTFWCTSALQSCVANEFVWKWATVIDGYRCLSVYHHFTMIFINSYRFFPFKWHKLEVHSIDRASWFRGYGTVYWPDGRTVSGTWPSLVDHGGSNGCG